MKGKGCLLGCLVYVLFFPVLSILFIAGGGKNQATLQVKSVQNVNEEVRAHQKTIEKYASQYQVSEYVLHIMAIMQVESGGRGGDPMQSSESKGLPPETITNPEESIEQGVKHFSAVLKKAIEQKSDIWAAVQSYNYGGGFIDYLNGNPWTFEKAERFSREQAHGEKVRYVNEISTGKGYDYRYNYGNMFYVYLVQKYLVLVDDNKRIPYDGTFILPLDEPITVTSGYNENRNLILQDGRVFHNVHKGVDFVNGNNQAEIRAIASGEVVFAGLLQGDGALVVGIKHEDELYSWYWHLSSVRVEVGKQVNQGETVGIIGTTGLSTGIHLHLAISTGFMKGYVDPLQYITIP